MPIKPLKIGTFVCPNNLILAPMAGISDSPFRKMCLKRGAGLVMGEMISAQALKFANARSRKMLSMDKDEHPLAIQIFGSDRVSISIAAHMAESNGADIIDINAGCPVKKILKSCSGAFLMKNEKKLAETVKAAVEAVKIPVTVKIRSSLNKGEIISPHLAKLIEEQGAQAVTVHARAVSLMHRGEADLEALAKTCAAVNIPVIGNGGIYSAKHARLMFDVGCAGIMIGRAAIGNPNIFNDIIREFRGEKTEIMKPHKRMRLFLELISQNIEYYGEKIGILRSRKTAGYWLNEFSNCSSIKAKFMSLKTFKDIEQLFNSCINSA